MQAEAKEFAGAHDNMRISDEIICKSSPTVHLSTLFRGFILLAFSLEVRDFHTDSPYPLLPHISLTLIASNALRFYYIENPLQILAIFYAMRYELHSFVCPITSRLRFYSVFFEFDVILPCSKTKCHKAARVRP